jgi:hypothetical protein
MRWLYLTFLAAGLPLLADVGDPQLRTDHAFYPGELACSSFERLFATQADQYRRVTGIQLVTDHDKALASWFWRNTHYAHGEEGAEDLWGKGFTKGGDLRTREYWTGLFAHGFGLCGTTHSQWTAEMEHLLGHGSARGAGVAGHNSFEVFLTGGPYGSGKWALLDHDLSTVIFDPAGQRLLSIREVIADSSRLTDRNHARQKQNGWLVCGLHPRDGDVFQKYETAEYLAGYAGPPPMVHLRRGETLRRYFEPGLEDGKTFVFWGRNYNTAGVPGPERSITWVNQPEKMFGSREGAGHKPGQVRFANARYIYKPNFSNGDYREGVVEESDDHVVFEFSNPYIIGATPPNSGEWGIYDPGCRNGLRVRGNADCQVSVSVDRGRSWKSGGNLNSSPDLTDAVKGHRQYFLRFSAPPNTLAPSGLTIETICQANPAILPRLKDNGTSVHFAASGRALVSAGPTIEQARAHLVAGAFGSPAVTLALATPRRENVVAVYAAAHVASGNPPNPKAKYHIDYSADGGSTWKPIVTDWTVPRRGEEPPDFWSQSFCDGHIDISGDFASAVRVRFRNNDRKNYLRAEAHLAYQTRSPDQTKVTYAWTDNSGPRQASHTWPAINGEGSKWQLDTGVGTKTHWVELTPVASP